MLELQGRSAKNKISNNSNNQNHQLDKTVQRRIGGHRVATWNILYYKVLFKVKLLGKTSQYLP